MKIFNVQFVVWYCESRFLRDVVTGSVESALNSVLQGEHSISLRAYRCIPNIFYSWTHSSLSTKLPTLVGLVGKMRKVLALGF